MVLLEAVEKKFCCNSCWVLKMNIDPLKQSVHIVIGSVPPPCLTISDQFKCLFIVVVVPFPHIACRENLRENSTGKHSNENLPSMTAKFNLMKQWGIPGVGLWTASGIAQSTPENSGIWELFKVWQGPGSGGSNGGSTTPSRAPSPESSGSGSNNPSPWTPPIPPTSPSPESTPDNGSGNDGNNNNGAKDKDDDHSGAVIAVVVCLLLVVAGGGVGYLVYQRNKQNYGFATNTAGMELLAKEIR